MKTSIVILTYNQLEVTKLCIESIRTYTAPGSYELIVVDNASSDGTVQWLEQQIDIKKIYNPDNRGFPAGCNQGMRIATGDNIMLLNNDVVVTEGWLENLLTCLYSQPDIGAVGPVTNRCAYYQTIPVDYQNINEMQLFAREYNKSNSSQWEERLKLIGYAFLFKRVVYDQVGELDEVFTPGNFEDDDFSFRIRNAGYKLILCKDTFIHHFGSVSFKEKPTQYQDLLKKNEEKFIKKWGFNSQKSTLIRYELLPYIHQEKNERFSLLEIGCGSGGTLLQIKNKYPQVELYGFDYDSFAIQQASPFAHVNSGNWDRFHIHLNGKLFDYIVINNALEKVSNPLKFLQMVKSHLNGNGSLILVCKNLTHIKVIEQLVSGESPFSHEEKRFYTLKEIADLIKTVGFSKIEYGAQATRLNGAEQEMLKNIASIGDPEMEKYYQSYEYILKVNGSSHDPFLTIVEELQKNKNVSTHLKALQSEGIENVIERVLVKIGDKIAVLNMLAVKNFEQGNYEDVIPYLQKAYELDKTNEDTLHNLIAVMELSGETELARWYMTQLDNVNPKETHVAVAKWDKQTLKFMLRRMEFEIECEGAVNEIVLQIGEKGLLTHEIIEVIHHDIIKKVDILNLLAVHCFEHQLYEDVIPFLQAAYEIDRDDKSTLFNLGYVLHAFGESEMAMSYIEQMNHYDEMTRELIAAIKGA